MELSQLEYFCDVADSEHMTKSARKLHMAQPALSQSIHRLERELGVELFAHEGRNIRLTAEGAHFKACIQPLLDELQAATQDVRAMAGAQAPVVRVGIFAASGLVVEAIADFMASGAEVSFEVTQGNADGRFDIGVRTESPFGSRKGNSPERRVIARFSEPIGIAVPADRGFGEVVDLAELEQERFISLAGSRSFRHLCDELCARCGFTPKIAFDSDSPEIVKRMIGLGLGVGFWPESSWGPMDSDQVRWARLRDPGFVRVLVVERVDAKGALKHEALSAFAESLVDRMKSTLDRA